MPTPRRALLLIVLLAACGDSGPAPAPDEFGSPAEPERTLVVHGRLIGPDGRPTPLAEVHSGGAALYDYLTDRWRKQVSGVPDPDLPAFRLDDGIVPPAFRATRTGRDGRFRVDVTGSGLGEIDLLFTLSGPRGTRVPGIYHLIRGIDTTDGDTADLGEVRVEARGEIAGVVTAPDGNPAAEAAVWIVPLDLGSVGYTAEPEQILFPEASPWTAIQDLHQITRTRCDEEGRYRLGGLRPGPYRVLARLGDAGGRVDRVEVAAGREVAAPDLVLAEGTRTIAGRILDTWSGEPVSCPVRLPRHQLITASDEEGRFRFSPVGDGEFWLQLGGDRFAFQVAGPYPAGEEEIEIRVERLD